MPDLIAKINRYQQKINKLRPFQDEMLKQVQDFYRIGLTWSSNAIEGNTLTESETKILLEDGLTVGGKPLKDTFEALGHAKSYDFMFKLLHGRGVSENDILTFHKLFYTEIDSENAGTYRNQPVLITGSRYPVSKTKDIPRKMNELILWEQKNIDLYHPVTFAALLHKNFVFIHPFIDGNGRIARLLMNTILIQNGYLPIIIPPIQRREYIESLELAHKDDSKFLDLIAEKEIDSQIDFSRMLGIDLYAEDCNEQNEQEEPEM